jgi:nesprin-1
LELDRQLSEIIESIEGSKSLSDNSNKLQAARKVTVTKSNHLIDNVTEDLRQKKPSSDGDQLALLRSHLLNLAVIENDLKEQKSSPTMSSDDSNQIVDTLNSLQKLFRETITEYNKLSTQLVNSSDNTVIFKIWLDYLNHVRSFLQTSLPSDYNVLKEQLHLCKIHQNLISNQRNALMHKISVDNSSPESLDEFKNKHVDILNHLFERQIEIESRLDAWEKYRKRQSDLLESIDDIEREKSLLQLKQIYLKSVPKTKTQIEEILSKVSDAEKDIVDMKSNQASLLNFIDDVSSSALRLEFSSTHQRLANIRASLETWNGFLKRIQELNKTYELQSKSVQDNYQRQLNFLNSVKNDVATNVGNSKQQLEVLKDKQKSLVEIKMELENFNAIKDEMKDYVSPYDIKMIRQTIWILWQQYTDLNYEYSLLLNQIEERICLQTEFVIRYENLMFWLNETEGRLMEASSQKYQSGRPDDDPYMKHYANNILEDFALKEYDRKWIQSVGGELLMFYSSEQNFDSPEKIDIECKLANLNTKWNNLKMLYDSRSRKVNEIKATYYNLEARIAEIRSWLFETEKELLKPYIFEKADKASFDKQLIEYEKVQRSVENHSANVAEILNLSEMVLSELRNFDMDMTVKNLDLAINSIEYRWKKLCESLVQRKRNLLSLWNTLDEMKTTTSLNDKWLTDCDNLCNSIETQSATKMSKEMAQDNIKKLNEYLGKIASETQTFAILEKLYNTVLTANVDVNNIRSITSETRRLLIIWKTISIRITSIKTLLENYLDEFSSYENQYENVILSLTQVDVEITNIKHLKMYDGTDDELQRLDNVKRSYENIKKSMDAAELSRKSLMETSSEEERIRMKSMSDEYFKLFNSIKLNYDEMAQQYENLMRREVVEERDAAVQVNTLQAQASVSSKDAYKYEILTAINEFRVNIDALEKIVAENGNNESGVISKTASQKVGKNIAACESSLELIKYLNSLLINDYQCDDDEAHTKAIGELYDRFQVSLELWNSKKETKKQVFKQHSETDWKSCPYCSNRNWQQIDNDLWRLEQWLHVAENERKSQSSPPSNIEELEDVIQDHREFLLNLDSHKSIISSLNIVGEHLAVHTSDTEKASDLRKRLHDDNIRWQNICQHSSIWQQKLQEALIGNREFHKIINEFNIWLEDTERKIKNFEPVDLASERSIMESKFSRFKELKCEIERCEPRVISLQENSAQLLKSSSSDVTANETYVK